MVGADRHEVSRQGWTGTSRSVTKSMPRRLPNAYDQPQISEVIYCLRPSHRRRVPLKWHRDPTRYIVEHHPDGSVTLVPASPTRYAVEVADDGLIELQENLGNVTAAFGLVQVRHRANGVIWLAPWSLPAEEFPAKLNKRSTRRNLVNPEATILRYEDDSVVVLGDHAFPPNWDRTQGSLNEEPEDARRARLDDQLRATLGEKRWRRVEVRRALYAEKTEELT